MDAVQDARIDWRRLGRRAAIGAVALFALYHLYRNASGGNYAPDFHHGTWPAGVDLLHGRSPYPPADPRRLLAAVSSFVTPPPLAVAAAPFAPLPYGLAIVLWNLLCGGAFALALRLLGVRDPRLYLLAFVSMPFIDSLEMGQPDGLFALAAAITWRYRDDARGAVALGALIAAKLLAAPLLVWLLVTRRWRALAIAGVSTVFFLLASWALIGFQGLGEYPKLLSADARAFEAWPFSSSLSGSLVRFGASEPVARWLALSIAGCVAITIVHVARRRDLGWFVAALTFGLLASPIMWPHYLVVMFVPLAISGRRGVAIWLLPSAGFWLALVAFGPAGELRSWFGVAITVAISIASVARDRVLPQRSLSRWTIWASG